MDESWRAVDAGGFQKSERAGQVRVEDRLGGEDAAVDVGLGGEVHDGVGLFVADKRVDQRLVGDVPLDEAVAGGMIERSEVLEVAGVGELVEVDHIEPAGGASGEQADESRADETGASGDDQFHLCWISQS